MKLSVVSVVELSGEHPNLPISEVLGSLRGLRSSPVDVWYEPRFLAFRSAVESRVLASRLAFGRFTGEALLWGSLRELKSRLSTVDLEGQRFRLRVAGASDGRTEVLEASLGAQLGTTGRVDLERPDVDLRLVGRSRAYLYAVTARIDRSDFETRAPRVRPFSLPVTLPPRFARALVNLTGVAAGQTLLDPFCGTGGILMEASLVGARPVGLDLREDVIAGCRKNLAAFGMKGDLHAGDVGEVDAAVGQVDAIATDPPYGRGASTQGEDLPALLRRAFAAFARVLGPGGRLAIALPRPELMDLGREAFTLVEWHRVRVHRSLDRYFCLFRRPRS